MSTPKINFFIKKIAGREPPGRAPGRSGRRTIVRVSSPGSARARSSAGEQEMLPGETSRKTPVCPDTSPLQCPDPEQLFCIPRWESPDLQNEELLLRVRVAHPAARWYNIPNNSSAYPRSRRWRPRYPDYPEHFPMEGASPTPQSVPIIPLGFRYPLLLGFVRLLWEFLLV